MTSNNNKITLASTTYAVVVTNGCPSHHVVKGQRAIITFEPVAGAGVRAIGLARSLWWCSGSRSKAPALAVGDTINLNTGDPTRRVTVKVVALA